MSTSGGRYGIRRAVPPFFFVRESVYSFPLSFLIFPREMGIVPDPYVLRNTNMYI